MKALNPARVSGEFKRPQHGRYWDETANLALEYFELQAGALDSGFLVAGFIGWLKRSPAERHCCRTGDDMARAKLWSLQVLAEEGDLFAQLTLGECKSNCFGD